VEKLEKRLRARGMDDEEKVKQRLETAAEEIKQAEIEGFHDKILVNDNLADTFEELEKYIFQADDTAAEEASPGEEGEAATEAASAVAEGDDTTMAEGNGEATEKE